MTSAGSVVTASASANTWPGGVNPVLGAGERVDRHRDPPQVDTLVTDSQLAADELVVAEQARPSTD
jgi:hypothetical protein